MKRQRMRRAVLLAATVTMGLMAGVFALYAHTIMPGLARTDDRTFVGAFQAIDRAIINPWFLGVGFLGALVLTALAVALERQSPARPWLAVALVLYVASVAITIGVHVPLNDAIKAAGNPHQIADITQVREQFDEARWATWNLVRTATTTAAFICLGWSLILHDRTR